MKTKDQDTAKHGTDNAKHEQEEVALGDPAKQRQAGARESQEKAKKQKQKDAGKKDADT